VVGPGADVAGEEAAQVLAELGVGRRVAGAQRDDEWSPARPNGRSFMVRRRKPAEEPGRE
jgi:hypothetical protein